MVANNTNPQIRDHTTEREALLAKWREAGRLSSADEKRLRQLEAFEDIARFEEAEREPGPFQPVEELLAELTLEGRMNEKVVT